VNVRALTWTGSHLRFIDQTRLPHEESIVETDDYRVVLDAIRRLAIRGAPALGIAGAFGVVLAARSFRSCPLPQFVSLLEKVIDELRSTRPTAVNLPNALESMRHILQGNKNARTDEIIERLTEKAISLLRDDEERCRAIGMHGASLLDDGWSVLTHCNTGALATGGDGTALNVIATAVRQGKHLHVYVGETRPLLQGARLTTWELRKLHIPHTLITDSTGPFLMQQHRIDAVIVGADRIALNGDIANKVGTYALALAAYHHHIPFFVAAPMSTFDTSILRGEEIPIEERSPEDVLTCQTNIGKGAIAPEGTEALAPAFDITPAAFITAVITDRGVVRPPFDASIPQLISSEQASWL